MPKIFIAYRHHINEKIAERLHERLVIAFDADSVFLEFDSVRLGTDFRKLLRSVVAQSDIMLAVIASGWDVYQGGPKQGDRRFNNSDDVVRFEIETALSLGIPVIPVLVDGRAMPKVEALPNGMKELAYKNPAEVQSGPQFNVHVEQLINALKDLIKDPQELWDGLRKAEEVSENDPDWGLNRARKVLERVIREIYERRFVDKPAATQTLMEIVERLVEKSYLPSKLDFDALLTPGVTDRSVTPAEAKRALTQLAEFLKWYTEVEQREEVGELPASPPPPEGITTWATDHVHEQKPDSTIQCSPIEHRRVQSTERPERVFVSHSSEDRQFVEREIIEPLRKHGLQTWYSTDDIDTATQWEFEILEGLESCDWFLVALSPHSIRSRWVGAEISWALDERLTKFVPVLIEDCEWRRFHLLLRRYQYADFRQNLEEARRRLFKRWGISYRPT